MKPRTAPHSPPHSSPPRNTALATAFVAPLLAEHFSRGVRLAFLAGDGAEGHMVGPLEHSRETPLPTFVHMCQSYRVDDWFFHKRQVLYDDDDDDDDDM